MAPLLAATGKQPQIQGRLIGDSQLHCPTAENNVDKATVNSQMVFDLTAPVPFCGSALSHRHHFLIDTLSSPVCGKLRCICTLVVERSLHVILISHGVVITGAACAPATVAQLRLVHGFAVDGAAPVALCGEPGFDPHYHDPCAPGYLSANQRVKQVERERANLARFSHRKSSISLVGIHTPFSFARSHPAAVLFADMIGFTAYASDKSPAFGAIGSVRDLLGC